VERESDAIEVGRFYGRRELDISPELVQAYSEGVSDFNPWYYGDSPFGNPVAPALALHSEVYRDVSWCQAGVGAVSADHGRRSGDGEPDDCGPVFQARSRVCCQ
jgi:hypothetical protein